MEDDVIINACVYCRRPAQGNYSIHRDGMSGPEVPLCDDCGSTESPSLQEIWARIALNDDDGKPWGPTIDDTACPLKNVLDSQETTVLD